MDPVPVVPAAPAAAPPPAPAPSAFARGLVEWRGRLPVMFAAYLDRLRRLDFLDLYGVVCRFDEVRELVGIARRVHQILDGGPRAAANGRWSFEEFMKAKRGLHERIRSLHRHVSAVAMNARIMSPAASNPGGTRHAAA